MERVKSGFHNGLTRPLSYRLQQLRSLCSFLTTEETALLAALQEDFKSPFDARGELDTLRTEVIRAIDELPNWIQPKGVPCPWTLPLDRCYLRDDPRGTVLIIAPWNYPLDLLLEPLVGALAGGCAAVLKPSEVAPATARLLIERLPRYLDEHCYAIVGGGPEVAQVLLSWPKWNLIFYTGNTRVGKIVQQAAAVHLIPTVLELGGKSPCIVSRATNLEVTAKRIAWGKCLNGGQTCVAPDYVLTFAELVEPLKEALERAITTFFGADPCRSPDYTRIVNERHWERLSGLLSAEPADRVITIGGSDRARKAFAPTLVIDPPLDGALMREEIFGPILPIITIESVRQAMTLIGRIGETPLALYLFSNDSEEIESVLETVPTGSVCINDTLMQVIAGVLPFGGVGSSGMGRYKGRWSYETFTHAKPVMWRSQRAELLHDWTRNPPMSEAKYGRLFTAMFTAPRSRHL